MMKKAIFILTGLFLITVGQLYAQQQALDNARETELADKYFEIKEYDEALRRYLDVYDNSGATPTTLYRIGACYIELKKERYLALPYLLDAEKRANEITQPHDLFYYLGIAYHMNYEFDEAIKYLNVYKNSTEGKNIDFDIDKAIAKSINAKNMFFDSTRATVTNLGQPINTEHAEYSPVISTDEAVLIFTSRRPGNEGGLLDENEIPSKYGTYHEDIYISKIDSFAEWSKPQQISSNINTTAHEASVGLSPDGSELFIYRSGKDEPGNIYSSYLEGMEWTIPEPVKKNINSNFKEGRVSVTADGTEIYFSSDRPGGYGKSDIYKVKLIGDNYWSKPINLGPAINTPNDEEAPFIHPDGKTLYFSSNGHLSMGGVDIFKALLDNDEWGNVENLGYPINTVDDDKNFVLSANGQRGYYASNRFGGYGKEDIYQIDMPESNIKLTMVKGIILGGDSLKPVQAKIRVIDKAVGKTVKYVYDPNPKTGKYLMIFPPGRNYTMIIDAEGYLPNPINIYVPNQTRFYELFQEITLQPVKGIDDSTIGHEISVKNFFEPSDKGAENEDKLKDLQTKLAISKDKQNEKSYDPLIDMIFESINTQDSVGIYKINDRAKELDTIARKDPLRDLIDELLEKEDTIDLSEIEVDSSATSKSTYIYSSDDNELESIYLDGDTLHVLPEMESRKNPDSLDQVKTEPYAYMFNKDTVKTVEYGGVDRLLLRMNISYDVNGDEIKNEEYELLETVVYLMTTKKNLRIDIYGHTDDVGDSTYNYKLSLARAQRVVNYLKQNGVPQARIKMQGLGSLRPLDTNTTTQGRALNRRAEIILWERE